MAGHAGHLTDSDSYYESLLVEAGMYCGCWSLAGALQELASIDSQTGSCHTPASISPEWWLCWI
jgi:hypothetical protein